LSNTALNVEPWKMEHENNIAFVTARQTSLQIYLRIARDISKARNAIKWEIDGRREKIENIYLGVRFNLISIVDSSPMLWVPDPSRLRFMESVYLLFNPSTRCDAARLFLFAKQKMRKRNIYKCEYSPALIMHNILLCARRTRLNAAFANRESRQQN